MYVILILDEDEMARFMSFTVDWDLPLFPDGR